MAAGPTADLKRGPSTYIIDPERLVVVGHDTPHQPGSHPLLRTQSEYDRLKAPLNEATVVSMVHIGVRRTIFVRRNGSEFEVTDGRRRVLHMREANRRRRAKGLEPLQVRFEIKQHSDEQHYAMSRVDNRHHMDESALQTAEAASIMLQSGMTEDVVAAHLGVGVPMLRIYLSLNDLAPEVRDAISHGVTLADGVIAHLAPTAAAKLAKLSREDQVPALRAMVASGDLTVGSAAAVRRQVRESKAAPTNVSKPPPRRMLTKLVEAREDLDVEVAEGFWEGVEFALGRVNPKKIKGMTAAIHTLTSKKVRAKA